MLDPTGSDRLGQRWRIDGVVSAANLDVLRRFPIRRSRHPILNSELASALRAEKVSVVPNDINGNGGVNNEVLVQEKVVPGEAVSETRSQGKLMESVDAVMHCGKYLRPHSSRHRQYWIQTWIL
ncbi:hypothetical protein V6N13_025672 [Hibiscus sabdariffa]